MFIIIDGIDGSGKSTILKTWEKHLTNSHKRIFDLKKYWLAHKEHPTLEEILPYDVLFSGEPTHAWIGRAIRQEIIKTDTDYSATAAAQAYALDRLVLYKRLIVPFLEADKTVIQDRGVTTSLCYQPIQGKNLTIEQVATLEGNAFALRHRPDHFIIADLPVDVALNRLDARTDKQDDAKFEKEAFLKEAKAVFLSKKYQSILKKQGTVIHILNTDDNIDIMNAKATDILQTLT